MNCCMKFPDSVDEFMEEYKMVDTEHIYSNGTEYVPIFRMKQWFEYIIGVINADIEMTNVQDDYSCGLRNGMRLSKQLLDGKKPEFEKVEEITGTWVKTGQSFVYPEKFRNYSCSECGYDIEKTKYNYCPNCRVKMGDEANG